VDNHISITAFLHIFFGFIGIIMGIFIVLSILGISLLVGFSAPPGDAMIAVPIIGIIGFIISGLSMFVPIIGLLAGFGIMKRSQWGRILGVIVSILYLPVHFPFGAMLGIYTMWVLFSAETSLIFNHR